MPFLQYLIVVLFYTCASMALLPVPTTLPRRSRISNHNSGKPQLVHPALRTSKTASRISRHSYGSGTEGAGQPRFDDFVSPEQDELCDKQVSRPWTKVPERLLKDLTLESIQVDDRGPTMQILLHCVEGVKETSLNATDRGACIIFPKALRTVVPGTDLAKLQVEDDDGNWKVILGFSDADKEVNVPRNTTALLMIGDLPTALL